VTFSLRADRHVRAELPAALARATAAGLTELGVVSAPLDDPDWLDAYVARVRAADALVPARVTAALALPLPVPRLTIHPRLSRVDGIVLVPDPADPAEAVVAAAVRAAAGLPVPVTLAGLDTVPAGAAAALAAAGIAVEVTERWRTPPLEVAVALHAAGVELVAGSAARAAADVGRWVHARRIAAALAPVPHPA
jgi:hypothetical protein